MEYCLKRLDESAAAPIGALFADVFSKEPWKDDWSDKKQLQFYIQDLIGQNNSLTFGLYEKDALIGVAMGRIKHWYSGTEYCIDELCISAQRQGRGLGAQFIREIEGACKALGIKHLFLLTADNVPAYAFYQKQGFYELKNSAAFAKEL